MTELLSPPGVLIAALFGLLLLRRQSVSFALGIALGCPLFFEVADTGIEFSRSVLESREGVTLPISVFALPLFLPEIVMGLRRLVRPVDRAARSQQTVKWSDRMILIFAIWALVAFAWGIASGGARPLILLQVLLPLALFLVARSFETEADFRRFLEGLVLASLITALLLVLSTAILTEAPAIPDDRLNDEVIGGFVVFQAWDYLPVLLVLTAFAAFGLHRLADNREKYLAAGAVLILVVPALYSRGAMLTLLVALVLLALGARQLAGWRLRLAAVGGICLLVVAFSAVSGSSTQRIFETLGGGTSTTQSDETRSGALRKAVRQVRSQPIFGQAMTPTDTDPVTGVRKTVNAHNQYLDYAVRGGLPLMLAFVGILILTLRLLWQRARQSLDPLWLALAAALTSVACASNLLQVSFVQPLTAFPLWFLLGIVGSQAFGEGFRSSRGDVDARGAEAAPTESRTPELTAA